MGSFRYGWNLDRRSRAQEEREEWERRGARVRVWCLVVGRVCKYYSLCSSLLFAFPHFGYLRLSCRSFLAAVNSHFLSFSFSPLHFLHTVHRIACYFPSSTVIHVLATSALRMLLCASLLPRCPGIHLGLRMGSEHEQEGCPSYITINTRLSLC